MKIYIISDTILCFTQQDIINDTPTIGLTKRSKESLIDMLI